MSKITLKEVPYTGEGDDDYYIALPGIDRCFEIFKDDEFRPFGLVYISENTEFADGTKCSTYINWIEFVGSHQGQHLLRPTLSTLYERFGDIYLEGTKETTKYYEHIGCDKLGVDKWTGLPKFKYCHAA